MYILHKMDTVNYNITDGELGGSLRNSVVIIIIIIIILFGHLVHEKDNYVMEKEKYIILQSYSVHK